MNIIKWKKTKYVNGIKYIPFTDKEENNIFTECCAVEKNVFNKDYFSIMKFKFNPGEINHCCSYKTLGEAKENIESFISYVLDFVNFKKII